MTDRPHAVTVAAHAKINAFLRVVGRRDDGYHDIETLILPISLHDDVELTPSNHGGTLDLGGDPELVRDLSIDDPVTNLAVRARSMASDVWTPTGGTPLDASIRLTKRIPLAAGLGGGSADAAAVLWAADDLWAVGAELDAVAAVGTLIGSDVPAMVHRRPVLVEGRGERITPVRAPLTWWVIVPLGFPVRAADAYGWWDEASATGPPGTEVRETLADGELERLGGALSNDLQPGVVARHPEVGRAISALASAGALGAVMSGSGPTVVGLARDRAHAEELASVMPGSIVVLAFFGRDGTEVSSAPSVWAESIYTGRLHLEPMMPAHADEVFAVLDDERLHRFIGGRPDSLDETRTQLRYWASQRSPDGREAWCNWVVRNASDELVGTVQATVVDAGRGVTGTLGWIVGSAHQGNGYATEAIVGLVAWLHEEGVAEFEAHIHPDNEASATVARRAGLQRTDEVVDGEIAWRSVEAAPDAG